MLTVTVRWMDGVQESYDADQIQHDEGRYLLYVSDSSAHGRHTLSIPDVGVRIVKTERT